MLPVTRALGLLALAAALSGCFVEAEAREVCQRSPALAIDAMGDGRAEPLSVRQHVDFAVPVTLSDQLTLDVALKKLVLRETSGAGTMDFVSDADIEVAPPENRQAPAVTASLAPLDDGSFGYEGELDVTPMLSGETFRYTVSAEGTTPAGPRTVEAEACVSARVWLSLP